MDEKTLEREREREKAREKFFCFAFFRETCRLFSFASLLRQSVCENLSNLSLLSVFFRFFGLLPRRTSLTRERRKKKKTRDFVGFCYSRLCFRIIINHTRKERERNVNNTFGWSLLFERER